ncbi:MAG: yocK 1 [Planctomycetaceae bacterium]|nr:yocK 1 [Planctomycetaceae bacterium]
MKRQELDEYRVLLEILRARLRGDMSQLTSDALGSDREEGSTESKSPTHMAELGSEAFEQDFALSLVENEQGILDEIAEALERIKTGTYGLCLMCLESGKSATQAAIPKTRLRVIPFARNCIECERKRERRN